MTDWPLLSTVTFLPLVGVAILLAMRGDGENGRQNVLYTAKRSRKTSPRHVDTTPRRSK